MTFESFLASGRPDPRTSRAMRRALVLALAVHAALLVAAVVQAAWRVDEISPPAVPLTFFGFTTPPPQPPPPAGSRTNRTRKIPRRTVPAALTQPLERQEPVENDHRDLPPGDEREGPRGDDGLGPPCEAADCTGPSVPATFVAPNVASGRLAIDPQAERYRVKLPPALSRAGMRLWVLAKLCVRPDGQVDRVSLLRGADPTLDPLVVATLQTWRYRPYSVNGRPVPFCTNVRYEIATQ
jgi:protein TonB